MDKHLHIISFNVPWPANYGGVTDVFYRIKTLSEMGVAIHLHCFTYGRDKAEVLNSLCKEVIYYKRDTSFIKALSLKPFIVVSRQSDALVNDLLKDNYPILCEGLHTTALLYDKRLSDRDIYLRAHNVEQDYYRLLADSTPCGWRRLFHKIEAFKLSRYEKVVTKAKAIFAVSPKDAEFFSKYNQNTIWIPLFHESNQVTSAVGRGKYLLYHGNLSVSENVNAAEYLMDNLFSKISFPCYIAGLDPPISLEEKIKDLPNVQLIANPSDTEMDDLIQNAQLHLLVTFQPTGMKLKLLNALLMGRYCVVNSAMVEGTELEKACIIADTAQSLLSTVKSLWDTPFTEKELQERRDLLQGKFDNYHNAEILLKTVFSDFNQPVNL